MKAADRDALLMEVHSACSVLDERSEKMIKKLDAHNGDIRALKAWQQKLTGAFAVLAFVVVFFQHEILEAVSRLVGG